MRKQKNYLAFLIMGVVFLSSCKNNDPHSQTAALPKTDSKVETSKGTGNYSEFQKNMHQSTSKDIPYLCEGQNGYYFQYGGIAYFIDKKSNTATTLCAKPECNHNDDSCNGWLNSSGPSYFQGKVYFVNGDYVLKNGKYTNQGTLLYSMEQDGTKHEIIQSLEFTPGGNTSLNLTVAITHKGKVYFVYSGVLYCVPLGENIEKAEKVYGEEVKGSSGSIITMDPNAIRYTLWADQNDMYFMVNKKRSDGTYKDTLFSYNPESKEVKQKWQVPDESEVGEWQTTGVSVSQWYLTNGYLYFYLSGGDLWRADMDTGKNEKIAETSKRAKYGTAIFSDQYMCLLNDTPGNSTDLLNNTQMSTGGDVIYVYGMDGAFIKEISLKELYKKNKNIEHCEMMFASENKIYFLVDASTWDEPIGAVASANTDLILCCADFDSGEITEVYHWN